MTASTQKAIDTRPIRKTGGLLLADQKILELSVLEVSGSEARRFLQAQTTNDLNALSPGGGQLSSLLDRLGKVVAVFNLYRPHEEERYTIVCQRRLAGTILEHLEKFKFRDDVEFNDLSHNLASAFVCGPRAAGLLSTCSDSPLQANCLQASIFELSVSGVAIHAYRVTYTGELDYLLVFDQGKQDLVEKALKAKGEELEFLSLSEELLLAARVEAGIPLELVDFNDENILAETTLDDKAVSYTKGCFQGQEVLARIKSQGSPTKALVGLKLGPELNAALPLNAKILNSNTESDTNDDSIGWLKSNCFSSLVGEHIALAMVRRHARTPDRTYEVIIDGNKLLAKVVVLPFYTAPSSVEQAKQLYDQALKIFVEEKEAAAEEEVASTTADTNVEESQSVKLLREVLLLNPQFEDAYESLGVILSKRGKLDEAIELMKKLAEMNTESVMAHSNLSTFYIQKGWKEKAEEELAESMAIRMRQAMRQKEQEKEQDEKKKADREEAKNRMEMFSQVLGIDKEDLFANFGMGDCLNTLERYEEAIPYLEKAIKIKKTHTVAYLALGKAFEAIKKTKEARDTFEKGIEVAAQRGDMEPMKEMRMHLASLANS